MQKSRSGKGLECVTWPWGRIEEEEGRRRIERREVGAGTSSGRIRKAMARSLGFI